MKAFAIVAGLLVTLLGVAVVFSVAPTRHGPSARATCRNNLKLIGLALDNYVESEGSFPPAYVPDENGRPAHSWRVLLLPYLEEAELYGKYRFDEPWNGPHNSKLAAQMPEVYRCPSFYRDVDFPSQESRMPFMTSYVAITDADGVFDGDRATAKRDIPDGLDSTIIVADSGRHCVHWMQPTDATAEQIFFDLAMTKHEGGSHHTGGMHFLWADGAVYFHNARATAEEFKSIVTRNGGETVDRNVLLLR